MIGAPIANVAGTDTIVFDKTGTLTIGIPEVTFQKNYTDEPETISRRKSWKK